jgi:hypothetical protein
LKYSWTGDYDKDLATIKKELVVTQRESLDTRDYTELHIALGDTAAKAYEACEFAHSGAPGLYLLP